MHFSNVPVECHFSGIVLFAGDKTVNKIEIVLFSMEFSGGYKVVR